MRSRKTRTFLALAALGLAVSNVALAASPDSSLEHSAHKAFARGQYEEAARHYQLLLRDRSDRTSYRWGLARSYELSGRLKLAEDQAEEILEASPDNVDALLMLGRINGQRQDWVTSKAFYDRAVAADGENASAFLGLGQALSELGDVESADAAFASYRRLTDN